jgi:hypothetical protein
MTMKTEFGPDYASVEDKTFIPRNTMPAAIAVRFNTRCVPIPWMPKSVIASGLPETARRAHAVGSHLS